jgi:hypothetical protein
MLSDWSPYCESQVATWERAGSGTWRIRVAGLTQGIPDACVLVVEAIQGEVPLLDPLGRPEVTLGGPAQVRPLNANLLRLVKWTMSLRDGGEGVLEFTSEQPFHETCEISISGGPFRGLLWEPRLLRMPSERLETPGSRLLIRVYTTLIRPFEDRRFD